ncbi:beta-hexosaminidase 3 isoform X2 [Macadamia integrifolia]|uniref:beta-hexosaminidase 3 isoform X2 n=1 Tax=Macadamia integrifolia TaxID=60698 RepID=UPI001C4E73C8|nr:beta-hexosaminidase 3 isoform X2 [Macadamia integrifolia]
MTTRFFCLGFSFVCLVVACAGIEGLNLWPVPKSVSHGSQTLYMNKDFGLIFEGSKYTDASGILKDGFSRFLEVVEAGHVIDDNSTHLDHSSLLQGLNVVISSSDDELQFGVDESYKLSIAATGSPRYVHLEAQTVYGALYGLQTLSQLGHFNFTTRMIEVHHIPITIIDEPRFFYRGLLIDTSRHYQSLPMMKNAIDAMAYSKLNVLHWHIVDSQSFPLEIPSYPNLWNGAFSLSERYTMADAAEIVNYAERRGINVLAEIDVPGHALSWGTGYPSLWPSRDCPEPLDVSNEFTFKVIDGILSDFRKVFKFRFVHLGGDEVNTSCWTTTPHVMKWLGGGVAQKVVAAGLRCIVSNQDKWYLDHLDTTWQEFYMNEPLTNITNPMQQKLVIGGEVCMWGEHVDGSDLEQTIWPRAAAAAERLWSPYDNLAKDPKQVTGRLAHFRCLLNQRGIAAAPLAGPGRVAPEEPGSCYKQ